MRWLYHILPRADVPAVPVDAYAPRSLVTEGFVHASYRDAVADSARLYFPPGAELHVLRVDPRRLDVPVDVADTPRGPMPHVHGAIPWDAVREVLTVPQVADAPDRVTGTRVVCVAFAGMTLLDLVGVHDPLSRLVSMEIDPTAEVSIVAGTDQEEAWRQGGAALRAERVRPALDAADVLVLPGGPGTRALETDPTLLAWLRTFPSNRLHASVCTGALLWAAAGRLDGRRATTHASQLDRLAQYGAVAVRDRVVVDRARHTAAGVTAAIDLGLHLVRHLAGAEAATTVARQIEWRAGA